MRVRMTGGEEEWIVWGFHWVAPTWRRRCRADFCSCSLGDELGQQTWIPGPPFRRAQLSLHVRQPQYTQPSASWPRLEVPDSWDVGLCISSKCAHCQCLFPLHRLFRTGWKLSGRCLSTRLLPIVLRLKVNSSSLWWEASTWEGKGGWSHFRARPFLFLPWTSWPR